MIPILYSLQEATEYYSTHVGQAECYKENGDSEIVNSIEQAIEFFNR